MMRRAIHCQLAVLSWVAIAAVQASPATVVKETCSTQIAVNAAATVSFYAKKVHGANYLGSASEGEKMVNKLCLSDSPILAVTWDEKGDKHLVKSLKTFTHTARGIYLQYPQDFQTPATIKPVLCKIRIFNNTDETVDFYAGKARRLSELGQAKPKQSFTHSVPCFKDKHILARIVESKGNWVVVQRYKTLATYTNLNEQPALTFPNHFEKKKDASMPQHKYWLSLLENLPDDGASLWGR